MPGKPARAKAAKASPALRTPKQEARKRAAAVAKLSTIISKLRALEGEDWLTDAELLSLLHTRSAVNRTRDRLQNRLT